MTCWNAQKPVLIPVVIFFFYIFPLKYFKLLELPIDRFRPIYYAYYHILRINFNFLVFNCALNVE